MTTNRRPAVKVIPGQIWADKYPGSKGRTVRVVEVDATHATVEVATESHSQWTPAGTNIGRQTRVKYDHRGLNGYRLESEPESAPPTNDGGPMTIADLIAQLQQLNPKAVVVQSERAGAYSPVGHVEVGLYEATDKERGHFWVPATEDDDGPWLPEPGVDVHAVCLWAASWPRGDNGETGA